MRSNERKTKDTQPDLKGSAEVDGVDYWVSGWTNTSKAGKDYVKLSFEPKDEPKPEPRKTVDSPARRRLFGRKDDE